MSEKHVLAIDLGTGGPKVAVIDQRGHAISWSSSPVRTALGDGGAAEQDPEEMWAAIVLATRCALASIDGPLPPIDAVAVTSQYMSTIPVAADGSPTGPCILWMDTRGAAHNLTLLNHDSFMLFGERHGLVPLPSGNDNIAHAHVLRTHHPDAYVAARALLEPMDYVNARLTGRIVATQSTVFGQLVCDNRRWGSTEYDPDLVTASGLDPDRLAPLVPLNGIIGEITSVAARALGIPVGTPVIPGTIDSITSAVGSGALDSSQGSVVIGTTSVMVSHIGEHRNDLGAGLLAVPSPLSNRYYVMAENGVGGRALEWAQRLFGHGDDTAAAIADAAAVAPGAGDVMFLPWLLGSIAPSPSDDVRAAFVGLSLQHDRRHLLRAVLEGVALNLGWLRPHVEAFVGTEFPFVRFGGGGALSPLWAQMLADSLGRPVHRLAQPRVTNARGAAFLALAELGVIDIDDVPAMLRIDEIHEPNAAGRALMERNLRRLDTLHPALSRLPT